MDSTCYEEILWNFPFLSAAGVFFLIVMATDCWKSQTDFLHSLLFFYSFLEMIVWGYLGYLYS